MRKYRRNFSSKYGNTKVEYDGYVFDSRAECDRWLELKILERVGRIANLSRQATFELIPKTPACRQTGRGERHVSYTCDFIYNDGAGQVTVEDVKSPATAKEKAYIIKRKLMKWRYPKIHFIEIIKGLDI